MSLELGVERRFRVEHKGKTVVVTPDTGSVVYLREGDTAELVARVEVVSN